MSMVHDGTTARYGVAEVTGFASRLFQVAGLAADRAASVAEILVEADLLGHATHGLALAPQVTIQPASRAQYFGLPFPSSRNS